MTIVTTAIPRITDEFDSLDQVGWYGSAFFLTLAAFQSTWGKLYKYFPLKTVFITSISIFEVGSLVCGVSKNSLTLIIGRAIAGCGAAGIVSGCYIIIAFVAPPNKRPAYTGIIGAVFGCASVAGPLLGGVFTDDLSWRWCFYINLPIGGASLALLLLFFKTPHEAKPAQAKLQEKLLSMDPIGIALILAALTCILLDMEWGGTTKPWSSPDVIGTLVGFVFLAFLFIVNETWQGERALMVPRILRQRTIATCCIYVFFQSGGNFLFTYYIPIYFQAIDGTSAAQSGIRNLPLIVGSSLMAISSGFIIIKIGYFTPLVFIGSTLFSIGAGLIYSLDINSPSPQYIGYQAILGIGQGLAIQVPVIVCQAFSKPSDIPSVTATVLFFQMIGGAICVSAAQSVFSNRLLRSLPANAPSVNPTTVLNTGASDIRVVFAGQQLEGVLASYMIGLRSAFALGIACAVAATVTSWGPKVRSIHGKVKAEAVMA
ncbi:hypothetical protein MMC27_008763 [Xylographa pallens]|nr:hypothetical protein [Xylographa pallens]